MNIQPIKSEVPALPVKARTSAKSTPTPVDVQPDPATVERKRQLLEKLGNLSETRPEEAARAEAIVADTTYPSHELMSRLSRILSGVKS